MKTATPNKTASARQISADTATHKTPVLVVTHEAWGPPAVIFEGQKMRAAFPGIEKCLWEDYTKALESQFVSENTGVSKYWSNLGILETVDGEFYRYDEKGGCKFLRGSLDTDIIDWSSEPQSDDEGVRETIYNSFYEIARDRCDYPSDANLGNGQTDSVRRIVEEALTVVDRRAENGLEGGAQ